MATNFSTISKDEKGKISFTSLVSGEKKLIKDRSKPEEAPKKEEKKPAPKSK